MKTFLVFCSLFIGLAANAAETFSDVFKVGCAAYEDVAEDAAYSIEFSKDKNDDENVNVQIEERVASRIFKDTYWTVVYESDEQATSNSKQYMIGVDDVAIVLQKATMLKSDGKANGSVEFRIGGQTKKLDLYCDQK